MEPIGGTDRLPLKRSLLNASTFALTLKVAFRSASTVTRAWGELVVKAPPVVAFLKKFQWKPGEIDSVMLATQNGEKPTAAADAWIGAHADRVDSWVK